MKLLAFGEIMARMTTHGHERIRQARDYTMYFAGSEANVAVCLAQFGEEAAFVTKLPDNDLGEAAVRSLRAMGVDTSAILRGGPRMGLFFAEQGASCRSGKVIYDRAGSAIATADPSEFDWDTLLEGCTCLHLTGITPALSENCAQMCLDAARAARKQDVCVSCDINYRAALWSCERAGRVLSELMPYVDIAIANEEHLRKLFGIYPLPEQMGEDGELTDKGYAVLAARFADQFDIPVVAMTLRRTRSAEDNRIRGMIYSRNRAVFSRWYDLHIVDRFGGGDAFTAGLLYGILNDMTNAKAVEIAAASSALKHTVESDYNDVTLDEVLALVNQASGAGRLQR